MSDTAAPSLKPTKTAAKHSIPVVVWLVVLLVAGGAFGAAVLYSGGVDSALNLVGLGSGSNAQLNGSGPSKGGKPAGGTTPSSSTTSTTGSSGSSTATSSASTAGGTAKPAVAPTSPPKRPAARDLGLPSSARYAMYREQLQSQRAIGKLINNQVASMRLGTPSVTGSVATVPLAITLRSGTSASGTMTLRKYHNSWYFAGLSTAGETTAPKITSFDTSVVRTITRQQTTAANQDLIANGVLGGGYKVLRVTGVSKGAGTATVNVQLSGGTEAAGNAQFVCISKTDGATKFWFIARFAKK